MLTILLKRKTTLRELITQTSMIKHDQSSSRGHNHLAGVRDFSTAKSRYTVEAKGVKGSEVPQIMAIKTADSKVTQPSGH